MKEKDLCINIARAESEHDVISLLQKAGYWDNPNVWKDFGDTENNFATIGNQQSRPEAAIVEKIINAVDAVLMSEAFIRRIDPEGDESPDTISEALETFFKIPDGKLSNISASQRTRLADRIGFVATGQKTNPCYSIFDTGEGQTPKKMTDTFLSIGKSNKLRIPFVQGKFNMGGTGVFQFCGHHNLQLIISKRHPKIQDNGTDVSKNKWGFTVIRREDPSKGVKSSVYRYLAPNDEVLSFESASLPLLPGKESLPYIEPLIHGTFIKLYEYQMTGLKTNILFDLYNRLSLLMPSIALPVRLYERRGYSGHSLETTLAGLSVRLEEDKYENVESGFPTSSTIVANGQRMKASIYVFKKDREGKYKKDEGILFTINGQTHGTISKRFFSRDSVAMGYLANSILILVDCSEFDGRAREDLFMNSRDRLRSGELKGEIERKLIDLIRSQPGLRLLKEERKREAMENKTKDDKPLVDVINKMLKDSPTLSKLFIAGVRLSNPFKVKGAEKKDQFKGKKFPTFFTLTEEYSTSKPKMSPINIRFRIQYKTDAVNDYFDRDNDPGDFRLYLDGDEIENSSLNLWNGFANLNVDLPMDVKVDDILKFYWEVTDNSRIVPFEGEFYVKVTEPTEKHPGKPGTRRQPSSDEEGDESKTTSKLNIPNIIEIFRKDWINYSFDEKSALKVIFSGEDGYDFFINMDNIHLLTEKKGYKGDYNLLDTRYKFGMVLIGLAFLNYQKQNEQNEQKDQDSENEDIYSQIERSTRAISPFLLPMISQLGEDLDIMEG
ncbi:hypothetical protein [Methanocalculus sp.]|uniref:hypothetical protein n=1 Tax=Methanocalculus sp. TaxID=2004547 RepID=UPI0026145905|nr:hypothetical protein [Methanocalculus sp.]MDG6249841.1 hypothetical protein [Methanocalculus sp.]